MALRTGIYGGSFNPIHIGHLKLSEAICQRGLLDEVWFMVSPQNPLKATATDLLGEHERLELAQLAVADSPCLKACDFEFTLPRPSYTERTLSLLREAYPTRQFVLIIGADNWAIFPRWKDVDKILAHHEVLIYPREGYPIDETTLPQNVHLIDIPCIEISSTELRQQLAQGESVAQWLHPAVLQTIQQKGYYAMPKPQP